MPITPPSQKSQCRVLSIGLALVIALLISELSSFANGANSPNILFLLSDDQQWNAIHALGNHDVVTPNLDRLVTNGFTFTHTFCMGSTEPAVCAPSRAMMLTGRSLFRAVGTNNNPNLERMTTWPEAMRRAGYTTAGMGKWHNGPKSYARSFDTGGPVFFGGMNDQTHMPIYDFDPAGQFPTHAQRTASGYSSTVFADAAVRFLRTYAATNPFFLYVAFTQPHDPRMAPESFRKLYEPKRLSLPKNFLSEHPFNNGEMLVRDEELLPWPRRADALRREMADYYASISFMDFEIGRIRDELEKTGRTRNTLIIFASDHGLALGQHGLLGKQNLYEHSVRAPLIFSGPNVPRGKKSEALCYLFDIFPTVAEITHTPLPAGVEGKSLWPVIGGQQPRLRETIFGAYRDGQRMIRDERWKLIRYPQINKTQLFDLEGDPEELFDVSSEKDQAKRVAEMMTRLEQAQHEWGDRLPLTTTNPQPPRIRLRHTAGESAAVAQSTRR
jgi:arylsulfatase A-like enzyme